MDRRILLRLLVTGASGYALDVDKLLWIPGQRKFFLPSKKVLTALQVLVAELERVIPRIQTIFEMDDKFYETFKSNGEIRISSRKMSIFIQGVS